MPNIVNREAAEALIREQLVQAIVQDVPQQSVFMSLAKKLPNMTSKQTKIKVVDTLPTAYWVNGDTGMKQTSGQEWDNVYITAGELAVIVPIPDAVADDAEIDLHGEILPRIIEAIGKKVDEACFFGIDRPLEWTNDICTAARIAGNNVAVVSGKDYYDLILGEDGVISKVEEDGYMCNGAYASVAMRAKLRGLRDLNGQPIFKADMQNSTSYTLDGEPMHFARNGAWDANTAQIIVGDFSKAVYAIRQDITVKILSEGVIQDPADNSIIYNLGQQDMHAIRVVFRMGWALPNPATRMDGDRTGCPFAYLQPGTPLTTYNATFTVTTGADETPVAGAAVELNGSRLVTGAAGTAVFALTNGTYPYKVKKNGFVQQTGSVTINGAAAAVDVDFVAKS